MGALLETFLTVAGTFPLATDFSHERVNDNAVIQDHSQYPSKIGDSHEN